MLVFTVNRRKTEAGSNSSQGGALRGVFLVRQWPPLPYGSRRLWVSLSSLHAAVSNPRCPLLSNFEFMPFCIAYTRPLCANVISSIKTGNMQHIATPPEKDRATAVCNMHRKFGKHCTCISGDAGGHTDRHSSSSLVLSLIITLSTAKLH